MSEVLDAEAFSLRIMTFFKIVLISYVDEVELLSIKF